jgi:5'-nucleotidase
MKRILLTGDDGYNSIGTRLLVRALKDTCELSIAATKNQQSGVGGKLSLATGGRWGEAVVDGVPAFWVEGTPGDVMECAQGYYTKPFDLVISGVNLGANASTALISSGTYCAAVRALGVSLAPKALVMSWDTPPAFWQKDHDASEDISSYFSYPGDVLRPLIETALTNDLWGVRMLNINLPKKPTRALRFTKVLKDMTKYFDYPITVDMETHRFSYQTRPINVQVSDLKYDVAAIAQGYISITPCATDMTHFLTYEQLKENELSLDE